MLALVACLFDSSDVLWSPLDVSVFHRIKKWSRLPLMPHLFARWVYSTPRKQLYQGVLGNVSGMNHELVFDFCFRDASFFSKFQNADSGAAFLALYLDSAFYAEAGVADSLPIGENLEINYTWILQKGAGADFLDSVGDIKDSIWLRELRGWKNVSSADTIYKVKVNDLDSAIRRFAGFAGEVLMTIKDGARLQLRLSAPNSKRLYRIYGPSASATPFMRMRVY
jgi:hypothetical protein